MAEIDRRVSILLNALTERGFGWLAAEIIQVIEAGEEQPEEEDDSVADQRHEIELSISERRPEKLLESTHGHFYTEAMPLSSSEEQIRTAVRLLTLRLSDAVAMLKRSSTNLGEVFESDVPIKYQIRGSTAVVDVEMARSATAQLQALEQEIVSWLTSQLPPE